MKVASLLVLVIIHLAHSAPAAILERELEISGSRIDNKSEIGDTSGTSASSGRSRYYTSDPCTDNNCQTTVPTSKTVDHGDRENRDMCGYISCAGGWWLLQFALVAFNIFYPFTLLYLYIYCVGCGLKEKMIEKMRRMKEMLKESLKGMLIPSSKRRHGSENETTPLLL